MNWNEIHQNILDQLKEDGRPFVHLDEEQIPDLCTRIQQAVLQEKDLDMFLCILYHVPVMDKRFDDLILHVMEKIPEKFIIHLLSLMERHIIQRRQLAGEQLPLRLFEKLKEWLVYGDDERRIWILKIIDLMGNKGLVLIKEIKKYKPPFWQLFKKEKRTMAVLTTTLIRRYGIFDEKKGGHFCSRKK